jgi:hypothetical protein
MRDSPEPEHTAHLGPRIVTIARGVYAEERDAGLPPRVGSLRRQEQHERERDSDFPAENTDEDDPPFGNRVETKRKLRAVGCDGSEQEFDLFFEHESAGGREFWKRGDPGTAPVGA